jgi:hypothetical protein
LTQKFNGTLGKCYGGLLNGGSIYSTCHHDGSLFVTVIMMSTFCGRRARALAERSWNGIWLRRRLFTVLTVAIANLSHGPTRSGELFGERDLVLTNCSDRSSSVRRSSSRSCPSLAMAGQPLSLAVIRLPYRKENPRESPIPSRLDPDRAQDGVPGPSPKLSTSKPQRTSSASDSASSPK